MNARRVLTLALTAATIGLLAPAAAHADATDDLAQMMSQSAEAPSRRASGTISFDFANVPLDDVLDYIATHGDLSVRLEGDLEQNVTLRLNEVLPEEALAVLGVQYDITVQREGDRTYVLQPMPLMSVSYTDAPLEIVLNQLARESEADIVMAPDITGTVNLQLKNVHWREALDVVVKTAGFEVVEEEAGILRIVSVGNLRDQVSTRVFELKYVQPPDVYHPTIQTNLVIGGADQAPSAVSYSGSGASAQRSSTEGSSDAPFTLLNSVVNALSAVGRAEYEPSSNSLVVTDIAPRLVEVEKIIAMIDVPPPQVFVDVKFVSTDKTDLTDFGVDWTNGWNFTSRWSAVQHYLPFTPGAGGWEESFALVNGGPVYTQYDPTTGTVTPPGAVTTSGIPESSGFVFGTIDFTSLTAVLKLLRRDESTTIMQAPRLVTLDNQAGTIFVGETIRFAETFSASSQGGAPVPGIREAENSPVETGFQLLIIPHVVRGTDEILLTLIPQDNSLFGRAGQAMPGFERFTDGTQSIELPQITSRTVVTRVLLRHGQTLVLGGLINEVETESERKIPGLGDIPLLGWMFKNKIVSLTKQNLMIFITVLIQKTPADIDEVYEVHQRHEAGRHSPIEYLNPPLEARRALQTRPRTAREETVRSISLEKNGPPAPGSEPRIVSEP